MTDSRPGGDLELLPILPLRNSVVFPASVVPINVGRPRSVRLVEDLVGLERAVVGIVSQRDAEVDEPRFEDLYEVGTVARVVKVLRLGPNNYSVVLHGLARFQIIQRATLEPYMRARARRIAEDLERDVELDALGASLREGTRQVLALMPNLPRETAGILDNVRESGALGDLIASNLSPEQASVPDKQKILETFEPKARVRAVLAIINRQLEMLRVKKEVSSMMADESKAQREQILRQQMKTIKEDLGEGGEEDEVEELRERLRLAGLPDEVNKVARKQLGRLSGMQPQSAEYNVTRTYLEWLADVPWKETTSDKLDVEETRRCLNEDHYGLERIKKRIIEYMAVRKLAGSKKAPILCFIGPPGVGKTSLGRSIARSMGRRYHRIALGGVRDEAEIRGHRRTYVGALPGRIVQGMKKVGVKNPVIVLDEVDKMGADLLGDPAAALLEVLDPEQNSTFQDHYLDVPFDLSQVTFLCTANNPDTIPNALWDRMEIIECAGYTRAEKLAIATEFLAPKQLSAHGLTDERLEIRRDGIEKIIDSYTREAGVRGLEREIGSVCRSVVMRIAEGETDLVMKADGAAVEKILGPPRFLPDLAERTSSPGRCHGPCLDTFGRRHLVHRGDEDARSRRGPRDGQLEERHERERRDGDVVRAQPRQGPGPRPRVPQGQGPAPARPEGRHAEGRTERRGRDVLRARVAPAPVPREEGVRHDGGNHPARPSAAGRRHQREAARGPPRRHPGGAAPRPQRARPRRDPQGRARRAHDSPHQARRRDPAPRPRAAPQPAPAAAARRRRRSRAVILFSP